MSRSKDTPQRPHNPPTSCSGCGEPHWVGWEHVCIEATTSYEGLIPHTTFEINAAYHVGLNLGWVQAQRFLLEDIKLPGSLKQIYALLEAAKQRTDPGPKI